MCNGKKNYNNNINKRKYNTIVACSSSSSSSSSEKKNGEKHQTLSAYISSSQTYALLKQKMEVATKSEDYKEAGRIRDSMRSFEKEEPVLRLRTLMKDAIKNEKFEDAARYRDELQLISPYSLLKWSSDTTTLGVRVQVRSVYIESRSRPSKGQCFYAYRIRITNNSERHVQLLRRHWVIPDGNGKVENICLPNIGFEYSSACPLSTPSGQMLRLDEGDFEMKHTDKLGSPHSMWQLLLFLSALSEKNLIPCKPKVGDF
ncbi:hypothetical protein MKX01_026375 [Papaver californicum]|nr:hypothetical protein MKX01_026375 [Papaver californicum]